MPEEMKVENLGEAKESTNQNSLPVDSERLLGAISYLGLLVIIPIIFGRKKKFIFECIQQGIAMFAIYIIVSFLWRVPVLGFLANLAAVCTSIYGFWQASQGKIFEVPVVGKYAKQIKF